MLVDSSSAKSSSFIMFHSLECPLLVMVNKGNRDLRVQNAYRCGVATTGERLQLNG
ncbi:Uncharacterised protein [Serratia fonticola]|uniref:Uncharacterized protein n=1 Tax=Serratia fonticola TaxID=47917 RepID=A0A4U9WE38_SERFO|nr:Uncharacterised protein [Serratia fonticola]